MFILKRQDVDIKNIKHPERDQQIPILTYQGQTFRLMKMFNAQQAEEARAFWRDLTDNKGKACVLLEEPERYSVWGKVRADQLAGSSESSKAAHASPSLTRACLLVLQAVYFDIEDLLGNRQAVSFEKDLTQVFQQSKFPKTEAPNAIKSLLTDNPLDGRPMPPWQENHLNMLLQELHKLGKKYFGNTSFAEGIDEVLEGLPDEDRNQFIGWLNQSSLKSLWLAG
ncbi:MAG: Npun_F0813 family protein [Microcoleaceae cyanobacterium]